MTPEQIALVRSSFALVLPISMSAAEQFYERLFAIAPEVRSLFTNDMDAQGKKLMVTLATIVADLTQIDRLIKTVSALAMRHVDYGVKEDHYAAVGNALIRTVANALGPKFTPDIRAAWEAAYALISGAMIAAAYRPAATSIGMTPD